MIANPPSYRFKPFRNCTTLGWHLGIKATELLAIADRSDQLYYHAGRKPKADGTFRDLYGAKEPLRDIQTRILDRILREVHYPTYLMGGIRDEQSPRDYVRNAFIHAGRGTLIQEDAAAFYPSTRCSQVTAIFRDFFRFPSDVAECLGKLCTRNNELAQGASPSTYVANLVMWSREPAVELNLRQQGLVYTRYIDDINVSCERLLSTHEKAEVVQTIHALLRNSGYEPKRSKQNVVSTGGPMEIHGLNVHRNRPALPKVERKRIRFAVREFERYAASAPKAAQTWKKGLSVKSRLVIWKRLNPTQVMSLWERVENAMAEIRKFHVSEQSRHQDIQTKSTASDGRP